MQLRRSLIATGMVAALAVAGVTAAVANDPPPRIAFLANGIVPADALAAGPIAGQLGAPIYTTAPGHLVEGTGAALDAYDPDLVIVMGGPAALSDAVLTQVADVTGLSVEDSSPPPTSGIVRAAGQDRFETAAAAAALLGSYDPAFLPTDMQAADSDLLDGKDSSAFQPAGDYLGETDKAETAGHADTAGRADTAGDADSLDGRDSGAFSLGSNVASARNASSITVDDDVVLTEVQVTPADECGDGSTLHRYLAHGDARFQHDSGTQSLTRMNIAVAASNVSQPYRVLNLDPATTVTVGSIATSVLFSDVAPGSHDVRVIADTVAGTARSFDANVIVEHLGWTCGGSTTASASHAATGGPHPEDEAARE